MSSILDFLSIEGAKRILLDPTGSAQLVVYEELSTTLTLREKNLGTAKLRATLVLNFPTWLMQYRQTILRRAFFYILRNI